MMSPIAPGRCSAMRGVRRCLPVVAPPRAGALRASHSASAAPMRSRARRAQASACARSPSVFVAPRDEPRRLVRVLVGLAPQLRRRHRRVGRLQRVADRMRVSALVVREVRELHPELRPARARGSLPRATSSRPPRRRQARARSARGTGTRTAIRREIPRPSRSCARTCRRLRASARRRDAWWPGRTPCAASAVRRIPRPGSAGSADSTTRRRRVPRRAGSRCPSRSSDRWPPIVGYSWQRPSNRMPRPARHSR